MNPIDFFETIWTLFRSLAVEATIVIAFAAALHVLTRSAYWRRTIWQVATLGSAALVLCETTGVTRAVIAWTGTRLRVMRAAAFHEPAGRAAASGRAEPRRSPAAGAPGMARPYQRFMLPMDAKQRQGVGPNPTLTRPAATLSHPMGEDRGDGASRFAPPTQVNKAALFALLSEPPPLWWLGPVWMLGMVTVLARVALGRCLLCLFCRRRRGHADPALVACVEVLAQRMGIRRRVRVIASAGLSSPIAFGVFRWSIGLPEDSNFNPAQQEAMLAHELAHLAAHDPLWHLLADAVSAALWWHPPAWWLRHQLHAASESAADEASLLLNDGPSVLAECLVELGGRLPQRAPLARMRIEGNGFRSGLGRRVERLLRLDGHAWQPRARVKPWLAKTVGPVLLVAVAVFAGAWTQPGDIGQEDSIRGAVENSWRSSLASSALFALIGPQDSKTAARMTDVLGEQIGPAKAAASAEQDQSLTPLHAQSVVPGVGGPALLNGGQTGQTNALDLTDRRHLTTVVTDGSVLYQLGKFNEAEAKFQKALKQQTNHPTASYYLTLIDATRHQGSEVTRGVGQSDVVAAGQPWNRAPNPFTTTNVVHTGAGRERIYSKLDRIKFPETPAFDSVPLAQVLKWLKDEARKLDPDKQGLNFMIAYHLDNPDQSARVPLIDPTTGKPVEPPPQSPVDMEKVTVTLPALNDIRLADMVEAICKTADKPIRYSVEEYAVVFSYRTPEPVKLYTRTYKVDPNTFLEALERVSGLPAGSGSSTNGTAGDRRTNSTANINLMVRQWCISLGLDFRTNVLGFDGAHNLGPGGLPSGQQKAAFFNDRTGLLFVRATQQDLDIIDQALQVLNTVPPQVQIEAKFVEIREADSKALGFDWVPANSTNQAGQNVMGGLLRQQTNAGVATGTITGILTDPQFRAAIKTLEQLSGIDILSAPKVTTLSGREAQVAMLETRTIVTNVDTKGVRDAEALLAKEEAKLAELRTRYKEKHPAVVEQKATVDKLKEEFQQRVTYKTTPMGFGPTVTVLPYVSADGYSIRMEVTGTVKEFLGYDDPRTVKIPELSKQYQEPLPRYRTREVSASASVWDGQTVVLGGPIFEDVLKSKDKVPVLGDIPLVGRLFRHESKSTVKKLLVIFITPTIVDPAGNRVHADARLPYDPNAVPSQPRR